MTKAEQKLHSDSERLRRQLADAEAVVSGLRTRLAKIEAKITGEPAPESGLEMLWKAALPMAKNRSSKQQCRVEWNRIPRIERPSIQTAVDALRIWNRCEEYKKDGNAYVPGLHRWIKARQWENLPEGSVRDVSARYRVTPKAVPQTAPDDVATPAEIAAALAPIKSIFPSTRQ